ncbi:tRNA (adenosine(37)-N6)-dimethylallyltransferase MiaA [Deinococcus sp.]|uniref:tRNA (adenosine(37)-N6)-dimethylallyltransferase MiaA n=1 Tax=Deinococcus sp. TaxID=47478 RepID=UPI0038D492A8
MPHIPLLIAPTASGKSALAVAVATADGGRPVEIVCADAFTVYRGLDIGTAKPTVNERQGVPHHLLDVVEVMETYDVNRFVTEAEVVIGDILRRGVTPLVVGGTGFYLRALLRGVPTTPPADPEMRAQVEAELDAKGLDALLAQIEAVDPAEERRMQRNPRRVVRAVELLRRTGRLPGQFPLREPQYSYDVVAFTLPANTTADRITERTVAMLNGGWPAEAAWLAALVAPQTIPQPTVWQALGYREALAVHRGTLGIDDAVTAVVGATRQYAKRQVTFIRTQLGAVPGSWEEAADRLAALLLTMPRK